VSYVDPQEAYLKELQQSATFGDNSFSEIEPLFGEKIEKKESLLIPRSSTVEDNAVELELDRKVDTKNTKIMEKTPSILDSLEGAEELVEQVTDKAAKTEKVDGAAKVGDISQIKEEEALDIPKIDPNWAASAIVVKNTYSNLFQKLKSSSDINTRTKAFFDLDVMQLMGLDQLYQEAYKMLNGGETILSVGEISVFEASTKALGGILGAYEMGERSDEPLLRLATQIGDRLLGAWKDVGLFPKSIINLSTGETKYHEWSNQRVLLSEVGSLPLEFSALSSYTGDVKYYEQVKGINPKLGELAVAKDGLYPKLIDPKSEEFQPGAQVTVGSMADAFLQTLLKSWILSGYEDSASLKQFLDAADAIESRLVQHIKQPGRNPEKYVFFADYNGGRLSRVMEEFSCYYPGLLAEAVMHASFISNKPNFQPQGPEEQLIKRKEGFLTLAGKLLDSCYQMYKQDPNGLAPAAISFTKDSWTSNREHGEHRPETIRSLYYMASVTALEAEKQKFKSMGWDIFEAMTKFDDNEANESDNKMMIQTLRYAYLLFSEENLIDHTKTVLSTEGHPFSIKAVT